MSDDICADTSKEMTLFVSPVGIGESTKPVFKIYPNPADEKIIIEGNTISSMRYSLQDQLGRILIAGYLEKKSTQVDIRGLSSGIYFVKIGEQAFKFVKE